MNSLLQEKLADLAHELITPERFGEVLSAADMALGDTIEFEVLTLPDPELPDYGNAT